jgi:hypothetical protein
MGEKLWKLLQLKPNNNQISNLRQHYHPQIKILLVLLNNQNNLQKEVNLLKKSLLLFQNSLLNQKNHQNQNFCLMITLIRLRDSHLKTQKVINVFFKIWLSNQTKS